MKTAVLLLLTILFNLTTFAQYQVLHSKGTILLKSTGAAPKVGTVIKATDAIALNSKDAQLTLWLPAKGRFVTTPVESPLTPNKFQTLTSVIQPGKAYAKMPTKTILSTQEDFKAHFDRPYLFLAPTWIRIDTSAYKINHDHLFYLRFIQTARNAEVPKKLLIRGDTLILDPHQFLDMNGIPVAPQDAADFSINYMHFKVDQKWIANFNPIFPDSATLHSETQALLKRLHNEPTMAKRIPEEIYNFLSEAFGQPDYPVFTAWLKDEFGIQ